MNQNILGGYQLANLQAAIEVQKFVNTNLQDKIKGYKLIAYQRKVVNGWNHKLIYEDIAGHKMHVLIYENLDKQFAFLGVEHQYPVTSHSSTVTTQHNPVPSTTTHHSYRLNDQFSKQLIKRSYQQKKFAQQTSNLHILSHKKQLPLVSQVQRFIQSKIGHEYHQMKLIQYTKQHYLTYQLKDGTKLKYKVTETNDHNLELAQPPKVKLQNISKPEAIKQLEQESNYHQDILGSYRQLNLSAAAQVEKYLATSSPNIIEGLKLIKYQRQVVNGWNHRLTYQDINKKIISIIVYQTIDEGTFQIKSRKNI